MRVKSERVAGNGCRTRTLPAGGLVFFGDRAGQMMAVAIDILVVVEWR
jgi:hypothetical protein